jgi:hypothetical protein
MNLESNFFNQNRPSHSLLQNKLKGDNSLDHCSTNKTKHHLDNWLSFYNFGNVNKNDFRHSDPVIHVNNHTQESCRKKLLALIKELDFKRSKTSSISLAHLCTNINQRIVLGVIKMSSLSSKAIENTGPLEIRFVVLIGEINVQIENTSTYKNNGVNTVIRIPSYTSYTLENVQNDDAYIFFKCQSFLGTSKKHH